MLTATPVPAPVKPSFYHWLEDYCMSEDKRFCPLLGLLSVEVDTGGPDRAWIATTTDVQALRLYITEGAGRRTFTRGRWLDFEIAARRYRA